MNVHFGSVFRFEHRGFRNLWKDPDSGPRNIGPGMWSYDLPVILKTEEGVAIDHAFPNQSPVAFQVNDQTFVAVDDEKGKDATTYRDMAERLKDKRELLTALQQSFALKARERVIAEVMISRFTDHSL